MKPPGYIAWSHQNRSELVRIPAHGGSIPAWRLRSPDPACNPYLAYALLMHAGLSGIEEGLTLCAAERRNLFEIAGAPRRACRRPLARRLNGQRGARF